MNKVILLGRLTAKPELRYTANNVAVASFTIAVQRNYKSESGDYEVDFINCYAWRKTGEVITEHFNKGSKILVSGSIRVQNTTTDKGESRQYTRIEVESFEFIESKKESTSGQVSGQEEEKDPFAEYGEQIEISDDFLD